MSNNQLRKEIGFLKRLHDQVPGVLSHMKVKGADNKRNTRDTIYRITDYFSEWS